jgi:hypothetical protein
VSDELEGVWKEAVVAYSNCCHSTVLEGLRNPTNNLSQDSR